MTAPGIALQLAARSCPVCGSDDDSNVVAEANIDVARLGRFAFASRKWPEYMHHRLVLCPACDALYANPAPSPDQLGPAYRDAAYDSAEESRYASSTYAAIVRDIVPSLPSGGGALDIGAGDGAFLGELVRMGFEDVTGVEPSAAPIAAAPAGVRPLIRQAIFRAGDFEPGAFRLVTTFQTLEHVPDPSALCDGALRLLRDGGALVVICHDRRGLVNRALGRRSPVYDIEHLQLFSPRSLRELLVRSGFSDVRLRPVVNRYPMRYWLRLLPLPDGAKARLLAAVDAVRLGPRAVSVRVGNLAAVGWKRTLPSADRD